MIWVNLLTALKICFDYLLWNCEKTLIQFCQFISDLFFFFSCSIIAGRRGLSPSTAHAQLRDDVHANDLVVVVVDVVVVVAAFFQLFVRCPYYSTIKSCCQPRLHFVQRLSARNESDDRFEWGKVRAGPNRTWHFCFGLSHADPLMPRAADAWRRQWKTEEYKNGKIFT